MQVTTFGFYIRFKTYYQHVQCARPEASGIIRGQCPPNFVVPISICFKHIIKTKILLPYKCVLLLHT